MSFVGFTGRFFFDFQAAGGGFFVYFTKTAFVRLFVQQPALALIGVKTESRPLGFELCLFVVKIKS